MSMRNNRTYKRRKAIVHLYETISKFDQLNLRTVKSNINTVLILVCEKSSIFLLVHFYKKF